MVLRSLFPGCGVLVSLALPLTTAQQATLQTNEAALPSITGTPMRSATKTTPVVAYNAVTPEYAVDIQTSTQETESVPGKSLGPEIGVLAAADPTTKTPTTSSTSSTPTSVAGDGIYVLQGCFSEPPASSSSRALGANGEYATPNVGLTDAFTVPACLTACAAALAPNNQGVYDFAGVENSRYGPLLQSRAGHGRLTRDRLGNAIAASRCHRSLSPP